MIQEGDREMGKIGYALLATLVLAGIGFAGGYLVATRSTTDDPDLSEAIQRAERAERRVEIAYSALADAHSRFREQLERAREDVERAKQRAFRAEAVNKQLTDQIGSDREAISGIRAGTDGIESINNRIDRLIDTIAGDSPE